MTDAKARFIIATISFALRDDSLPSKVVDRQTSKEHTFSGRFSKSAFDFLFDDGTRVFGQATSSSVTAYVNDMSQKISMDYNGESSSTKITRAEDEKNRIVYTEFHLDDRSFSLVGSVGKFDFFK